jgi:hypothetical protein
MVFSPTAVTGTAVLEYDPTEILPQVGALSKHTERLCRPGREASRAHPRGKPGFWTFESGCGRETDYLLEGDGFKLQVPRCAPSTDSAALVARCLWSKRVKGWIGRPSMMGSNSSPAAAARDILCPGCKIYDFVALSPRTIHQSCQPRHVA